MREIRAYRQKKGFEDLTELFKPSAERYVITTYPNPDADGVACGLV